MKFKVTATTPVIQIDEEVKAPNAYRAVEVVRQLVHKFGYLVLLDKQEPTKCQGRIYKDSGQELLPVGDVSAVAVE